MSRNLLKELRRYAGTGDKGKMQGILRAMLKQEPDDCFALAEWQRLQAGKEPYSTLDYKSYRRILHEAAEESLRRIMQRQPVSGTGRMLKGKLRKQLATLRLMESRLQDGQSADPEIREYQKALRRELHKRNLRLGGRGALLAGIPLAVLLLAGVTVWQMRHRAETAAQAMEKAVEAEDWQRVLALKDAAKSGINKLLYPPMEASINKAEAWVAHKKAIRREARQIIRDLQEGKCDIANMPLSRRALMERYLRALPKELDDLSPAWDDFCNQARQQWLQQLPAVLAKIREPLPDMPHWSGREQDAPSAERYERALSSMLEEYEDAVDAYRLDPDLLTPLRERLAAIKNLRKELATWQRTLKDLSAKTDYRGYLSALQNIGSPSLYPPAVQMAASLRLFPTEEAVTHAMRDPGGTIPPAQMRAMPDILLRQRATFCREGAASPAQIELLDDLFTTRTLRTKLYRICSAQGAVAFSETAFAKGGDGSVTFRRAELDPAFRLGAANKETWREAGAKQQVVDPTGLVSAAGLERRTFFIRNNLPATLGVVLNYAHKDCPALAKAYVYDILLRVLQKHGHPALIGVQYSPTLQEDIRSFSRMKQALGIPLRAGCWLQPSKRAAAAEAVAADWFAARSGHDYAAEIKKNYSPVAAIRPVYIGYVGPDGQAVLCREPETGDELWYQGRDGLCNELRRDVVCAQAAPFSPVFVKAKGNNKKR